MQLFQATSESLLALGVPQERVDELWRLLAGILHLGNISFEDDDDAHHGGTRLDKSSTDSKVIFPNPIPF